MTALWFLLAALVISALGSVILVLRYRKPSTEDHSIEEFRREMDALAPDQQRVRPMRRAEPRASEPGDRGP